MASTLGGSTNSESNGSLPRRWMLAVAATARGGPPAGVHTVLAPGDSLRIGRDSDALDGALRDDRISRAHAVIRTEAGGLRIEDLGSHNGTTVNGTRVVQAELSAGDVVACGSLVLVATQVPGEWSPARDDTLVGVGPVHTALVDAVATVCSQPAPVLLTGETGVGKDVVARAIHDRSGRTGPFVTVDCGALVDAALPTDLFGDDGLVRLAHGGTLYLDGIADATAPAQASLTRLVETGCFQRAGQLEDAEVRVLASCTESLDEALARGAIKPTLAARLSQWVIHLPPLRERREDLAMLAHAMAHQDTGAPVELHPKLIRALLRCAWPGNLHGLRGAIRRAMVESAGVRPVPRPDFLRAGARESTPSDGGPQLVVGPACRWFRTDDQTTDLTKRASLAGVLRHLVTLHAQQPNAVAAPVDLLHAGWPGEAMDERAGINRVYVAISTLRKLGLRRVILRSKSGYRLDPDVVVRRQA